MTAKEHYDQHLGNFYSWMAGDFELQKSEFKKFLIENSVQPGYTGIAIDLGAGHGIQSIPLAALGFKVIAVDFNEQLLTELASNAKNYDVILIHDDIRKVRQFTDSAELVLCCGDTLSHLDSKGEVENLIADISKTLQPNGRLILSFRDYSTALSGTDRFIPVKSDNTRILTCVLDYETDHVTVTDLLHEKTAMGWQQKLSAYKKLRLITGEILDLLSVNGLAVIFNQVVNRMTTIIAVCN